MKRTLFFLLSFVLCFAFAEEDCKVERPKREEGFYPVGTFWTDFGRVTVYRNDEGQTVYVCENCCEILKRYQRDEGEKEVVK